MSEYMNTKGRDPQAISLDFDDNAFSTDDIVCNETVGAGGQVVKFHSPPHT